MLLEERCVTSSPFRHVTERVAGAAMQLKEIMTSNPAVLGPTLREAAHKMRGIDSGVMPVAKPIGRSA